MTLQLPVYDGTPETLQFILDLIAQAVVDTGGRQTNLRFGKRANCATGDTTVAHGMGSTPVSVVVTPSYGGGSVAFNFVVKSVSSTNFVVTNGSATTTDLFWIALG